MIIKICGIKNKETLVCCEKNKVDFFGMIFYHKSPRNISYEEARMLIDVSREFSIKPVGVFVNHDIKELKKIIYSLNLNFIQLHGDEDQLYIDELKDKFKLKIFKKISIKTNQDFKEANKFNNIDYLLFDYKPNSDELPGGNSKSFNWNFLKEQKIDLPWFVSGGINHENIKKLQNLINPYGIDLSSGVEEQKGIKSINKINKFFKIFYDK
tara:strand:- start:302 stop:934 length:633 start_codon:yes stop_codon:yes gene_type:complete